MNTIHNDLHPKGCKLALKQAGGTWRQNFKYCTKEDKEPWMWGVDGVDVDLVGKDELSKKRNRELEEIVDELEYDDLHKVVNRHKVAFIKNCNGIKALKHILDEKEAKKCRPIITVVVYGRGGVGKSSWVHKTCKDMGLSYYDVINPRKGILS